MQPKQPFSKQIFINVIALFFFVLLWQGSAAARLITDMLGRKVDVPDVIEKVFGTAPPATLMVYAFDPKMVVGLNAKLKANHQKYLDPCMQQLPVIGGWFGQGQVSNLETLVRAQPDLVLVWMWHQSAINEKIERALKPLKIPIVYMIQDTLADYPATFRFLGALFNRPSRAEALAQYAEQTLAAAGRVRDTYSSSDPVAVYYAEGTDGLSTECHTSIHAQLISLSGAENVHHCTAQNIYGMQKISMEQVIQYNPQVIVTHEPLFFNNVMNNPRWQNIRAIQGNRVCQIPRSPFNWFDRPPSFMRLIGLQWMLHQLYPEDDRIDLVSETQRFFQLFFNVTLDQTAARSLLQP